MSFVLFTFNKVALQVVTIDGKEWCRAKEVCKVLEYKKDTAHVVRARVSGENVAHKYKLSDPPTVGRHVNWPSNSQKYDLYISEEGLL